MLPFTRRLPRAGDGDLSFVALDGPAERCRFGAIEQRGESLPVTRQRMPGHLRVAREKVVPEARGQSAPCRTRPPGMQLARDVEWDLRVLTGPLSDRIEGRITHAP
jgi:hypothetical protein